MSVAEFGVSGGEIDDSIAARELLKVFECTICKGAPLPPIINCIKGHLVCQDCRSKLNICGMCLQPYSKVRNYRVEEIISNLLISCKFKELGCTVILKGDKLLDHIEKCGFSLTQCTHCVEQISIQNYGGHLVSNHEAYGYSVEQEFYVFNNFHSVEGFSTTNVVYPPDFFFHDGKYFISNGTVLNDTFNNWIKIVGTPEQAAKYEVTVTVFSDEFTVPELRWRLPVTSYDRSQLGKLHKFSLYWAQLKPFLKTNPGGDPEQRYMWKTKFFVHKLQS